MDKKGKTIKQLADEIGVSKQAIFYRINKPPLSNELSSLMTKENGSLMVSFDGQKLIREAFLENDRQTFDDKESSKHLFLFDDSLIQVLQTELGEKNKQLSEKDCQIKSLQENISELTSAVENLTKSLNSSQALHAGTMQQSLLSDSTEEMHLENIEHENTDAKKGFFARLFQK